MWWNYGWKHSEVTGPHSISSHICMLLYTLEKTEMFSPDAYCLFGFPRPATAPSSYSWSYHLHMCKVCLKRTHHSLTEKWMWLTFSYCMEADSWGKHIKQYTGLCRIDMDCGHQVSMTSDTSGEAALEPECVHSLRVSFKHFSFISLHSVHVEANASTWKFCV